MTPSEAKKSPTFRELERQAADAQNRLDEIMKVIEEDFPLDEGYWTMRSSGVFSVSYPLVDDGRTA